MTDWAATPLKQRLAVLRRARHTLAARVDEFADLVRGPADDGSGRRPADTIAAEVLPLCAAIQFLQRRAARILRPQKLGLSGRPSWLLGVRGRITRQPLGRVLILGTWNYPVFLTGVQAMQALAAGNGVVVKPGNDCEAVTRTLSELLHEAGLPQGLLHVLDDSAETGRAAVAAGFDHVVLTGSAETGRRVLRAAAETLTPCTVELSGSDAVLVDADADLDRTAGCVAFGLTFNGGATCIAPRRLFVIDSVADTLLQKIEAAVRPVAVPPALLETSRPLIDEAVAAGAVRRTVGDYAADGPANGGTDGGASPVTILDRCEPSMRLLRSDVFAPVLAVVRCRNVADILKKVSACPYALGASVFGSDASLQTVPAGCVTVGDVIVPTADPRVPFGGHGQSGYGVTRGPEGLSAMTRPKVLLRRHGRMLPHLDPPHETDADLLGGAAQTLYGDWRTRWRGLRRAVAAGRQRSRK